MNYSKVSKRVLLCIIIVRDYIFVVFGVVPKGLLTFLGSFYKEIAKSTLVILICRFERQTTRKKIFLPKTLCPQLRM